jgi:radical SAM protein with 4Fe4S-binding SPASM domain
METSAERIRAAQERQGRLGEAKAFPKVVLIDTCSYCNLRCSMCVHKDMTRPKGFMAWPLFKKIVDEIAESDPTTRVWMIFFGEPLIAKRRKPTIFDMIAYAKDRGLTDVVMNSNANLLDDDAAQKLISAGLDAIYIGIDAAKPESYARIRVGGDFDTVVVNVKNLLHRMRASRSSLKVFVQFVEMDDNAGERDEFVCFWSELGANVKIRPKVSWAGKIEAPNLVLDDRDRWPCYWAMQTMSVTDRGSVVTCAVDLDAGYVAGDINTSTLADVWNGRLAALRQLHRQRRFGDLPQPCRDCRDWQSARAEYVSAE